MESYNLLDNLTYIHTYIQYMHMYIYYHIM